jgi:hypothetical protein
MHLDEERIQRLLHGELEPAAERLARQHVGECEDCRVLLEKARAEEHRIFGLLRELDHPLPRRDPSTILAGGSSPISWGRWAAGLLLVAAAGGAAYAAPGSPLPAALDRLVGRLAPVETRSGPAAPSSNPAPSSAGIAVPPGDRLTIRFLIGSDSAIVTLSLTDGDEVVVRTVEGAASFGSDVGLVTVRSAGSARFEVLIPRGAPSIRVLEGDTPVFAKQPSGIVTRVEPDAGGRYTWQVHPPAP